MTISNKDDLENCKRTMKFEDLSEKPNLKDDRLNFCLLTLLYVIQGIPIGLSISIPMILQNSKLVTYDVQVSWYYNVFI